MTTQSQDSPLRLGDHTEGFRTISNAQHIHSSEALLSAQYHGLILALLDLRDLCNNRSLPSVSTQGRQQWSDIFRRCCGNGLKGDDYVGL
ncbi:hypothetical protein TNIN_143061 [Trichonephila inaurata madagascariensis]|uniref:Uncharacterized protein n=1 Tax=Trichonephila inaurata madagascariensis TaxID=2747483 RepID=A0A8X6X1F3_9ARAC|nr:hypothetical protein TNIN_143061 [Trichonephila inaurata madagascariensis]